MSREETVNHRSIHALHFSLSNVYRLLEVTQQPSVESFSDHSVSKQTPVQPVLERGRRKSGRHRKPRHGPHRRLGAFDRIGNISIIKAIVLVVNNWHSNRLTFLYPPPMLETLLPRIRGERTPIKHSKRSILILNS